MSAVIFVNHSREAFGCVQNINQAADYYCNIRELNSYFLFFFLVNPVTYLLNFLAYPQGFAYHSFRTSVLIDFV